MPEIEHIAAFTSQYITSNHVHSAEVLHVREVKAGCEEWSHHIEQLTETLIQLKCPQKEAVFSIFFLPRSRRIWNSLPPHLHSTYVIVIDSSKMG